MNVDVGPVGCAFVNVSQVAGFTAERRRIRAGSIWRSLTRVIREGKPRGIRATRAHLADILATGHAANAVTK